MVNLFELIPGPWRKYLDGCDELSAVGEFLACEQREGREFQPSADRLFRSLELADPRTVRAVCTAQDPYPGAGVPTGVAFSVARGAPLPASLKNIFREYVDDLGYPMPSCGDLTPWARQVLLLNVTLTCRPGAAGSHAHCGWSAVTSHLLRRLVSDRPDLAFLCWGRPAQRLVGRLPVPAGQVISCAHPSPLSAYRGWFGSRPFSRCNTLLAQLGAPPVSWRLP